MNSRKGLSAILGKQDQGGSPPHIKEMALSAKHMVFGSGVIPSSIDIGCGAGDFSGCLRKISNRVIGIDFYRPQSLQEDVHFISADLNQTWPLVDSAVDFAFALEVIEHLENPRHFLRQLSRILRSGGFGFVSTPNNHSLASKLTFLLKGQHRLFQDPSYPAHITPILQSDLVRILRECALELISWFYSNHDTVPKLHWGINVPGKAFSDCLGVLFRKSSAVKAGIRKSELY